MLYFEAKGVLFLHEVVPAIDNLTSFLDEIISDEEVIIAVKAAALSGIKVLNKYYAKTDESVLPRAAISE